MAKGNARFLSRANNDNDRIPFACKCTDCVHRGMLTGTAVNTQVYCTDKGAYVYASEQAKGCPSHTQVATADSPKKTTTPSLTQAPPA